VDEIDLDNVEEVAQVFKEVKDNASGLGLLKTGYQALNRMLNGGFRRGEEVVIGALQHKYKTGFTLSLFKQIALYNEPYMIDPTKKPLLVRISFEDSAALNTQFLYTSLYENKMRQKADLSVLTETQMAQYVKDELTINGYAIKVLKIDPTQYSYRDICNKLLEYESQGYEIHLCMLDYLTMVPTTGCLQGALGQDVRDMYRRMRNFCEPRKIALITPHQLSTEAKMKIRDGATNFVQQLVDGGFYDKCKTVDNEVDLELFIHIEKVNGRSYLTIQRGKHRSSPQTPMEYQYCVLPFEDIGGILDDINGPDTSRKKVGAGPSGSAEETPFWDFADAA
jgi:archaellum biogenesis ATPase FlaH